jgi:predicted MPP superfamily phosphohydrolase
VGHTIGKGFVTDVVARVNEIDADVIAITGDLSDGTVAMLRHQAEPLAMLKAKSGVFFVTGNHDYYFGDAESWVVEAARLGMTPLVNEHRLITRGSEQIVIAGVSDYRAGGFVAEHASDPAASLRKASEGAIQSVQSVKSVKILLAHQPRSVSAAAAAGFDLQLSGHTHGGQVPPFHVFARLTQPYLAGLHRHGEMWLYVSRGTGYWGPPLRLLAPSEISVITLRRP